MIKEGLRLAAYLSVDGGEGSEAGRVSAQLTRDIGKDYVIKRANSPQATDSVELSSQLTTYMKALSN